jgi:hypothetical protein
VRLAARGTRDLDDGERPIDDPGLVTRLRARARRVHLESLLLASALTGLALAIPG